MTSKLRLPAVLACLASLLIACGGDSGDEPTPDASATVPGTIIRPAGSTAAPSPSATLETGPEVTPTPPAAASAEAQANGLTLIEAPVGMLEFVTDGPYVVPGDALGVFYIDIATQAIAGWYDLINGSPTAPVAFSGENRFTLFERGNATRVGGIDYPAGLYLGDKTTGKVYRWEGDAAPVYESTDFNGSEITARGDHVLFRVPVEDGDDWFALLNVSTGEVDLTFEAEGQWALISRDGSRIAVIGEDASIVDAVSGGVERVDAGTIEGLVGPDQMGRETGKWSEVELIEHRDDQSFVLAFSPSNPEEDGFWQAYSWDGDLLAGGTGARVYASPGGDLVAVAERIPGDEPKAPWHSLNVLSTQDGSGVFRVVGVDEEYGWNSYDRWLADGSGIAIRRADNGLMMALRDGSFVTYPGPPSPDSPDVFDVGAGVADGDGTIDFQLSFQGGIRDFVDTWGDNGDEVRVLIPHGGHDGPPFTATIIEPHVEEAPYDGGLQLQLSDVAVAFGLVDLHEEPGGDTLGGKVGAPYRVTVEEVAMRCSGGEVQDCPAIDSDVHRDFLALVSGVQLDDNNWRVLAGYWARVTTPDGLEGWILLQVQGVGL